MQLGLCSDSQKQETALSSHWCWSSWFQGWESWLELINPLIYSAWCCQPDGGKLGRLRVKPVYNVASTPVELDG